jgi:hypothetical protein
LLLAMFTLTNYVIRIHRHYTFGLVYGSREEFDKHRAVYTWLPVVLLALIAPFALYEKLHVGLLALAAPGAVWNLYHIITQKFGVMRAYAVKLGYGDSTLERRMLLSWVALVTAAAVARHHKIIPYELSRWHGPDMSWIPSLAWSEWLPLPAGAAAAYYTGRWLAQEARHFAVANVPKLVFTASVALLLATFQKSLVVGYMVFGFSHALEYIAFVNIYGAHKPGLAAWIRTPVLMNPAFICGVVLLYLLLGAGPFGLVLGYTTYNSYLHFLYDGYLWKMRDPKVRNIVARMSAPVVT